MSSLKEDIEYVINQYSGETASNTPDFILAEYLTDCLEAFNKASNRREEWYGVELSVCQTVDENGIRDTRRNK